jgi:hypothetical protein
MHSLQRLEPYFESVKRGEYEHTLEVLAAYLVGELKQEVPEPGNFLQMGKSCRRLLIDYRFKSHDPDRCLTFHDK